MITLDQLTSRDQVDRIAETQFNKYAAGESLERMAILYRRSLKNGGQAPLLSRMIEVIGEGIEASDLEAWLLGNA